MLTVYKYCTEVGLQVLFGGMDDIEEDGQGGNGAVVLYLGD